MDGDGGDAVVALVEGHVEGIVAIRIHGGGATGHRGLVLGGGSSGQGGPGHGGAGDGDLVVLVSPELVDLGNHGKGHLLRNEHVGRHGEGIGGGDTVGLGGLNEHRLRLRTLHGVQIFEVAALIHVDHGLSVDGHGHGVIVHLALEHQLVAFAGHEPFRGDSAGGGLGELQLDGGKGEVEGIHSQGLLGAVSMGDQDLRRHGVHGLGERRVGEEAELGNGQLIGLIGAFRIMEDVVVLIGEDYGHRVARPRGHMDADAGIALVVDQLLQSGNGIVDFRTGNRSIGRRGLVDLGIGGLFRSRQLGGRGLVSGFLAAAVELQEAGQPLLGGASLDVAEGDDAHDEQQDHQQASDQHGDDIEAAAILGFALTAIGFLPTGRRGLVLFVLFVLVLIEIVLILIFVLVVFILFFDDTAFFRSRHTGETGGLRLGFQLLGLLVVFLLVIIILAFILVLALVLFIDDAALFHRRGRTGEGRLLTLLYFLLFLFGHVVLILIFLDRNRLALGSLEGAGTASGEIGGLDVAPLGTEILFHGLFHICGFRFSIHFRLRPQVRGANLAEGGVVGIVSPTFFTDHRISLLGHIYIETV